MTRLRFAQLATFMLALVASQPAHAQRYLTEIVISTTNPSASPIVPPELKFGSALNAYLLLDGSQVRSLMDWYGDDSRPPVAPLQGLLTTDRAALDSAEAKALLQVRSPQVVVVAVSASSLSAAGLSAKDLTTLRKATLEGIVSPRDPASVVTIGKGRLRF